MLTDAQYLNGQFQLSEIEHRYGKNVHILSDPYLFSMLAKLGHPDTFQPTINQLIDTMYRSLVRIVVNREFPKVESRVETRMHALHPEGLFKGELVDPATRVVCVNLARAGTVPSQVCYDAFNYLLTPAGVRQDHIAINRKVDADEKVIGTNLAGTKIGGDVAGAFVVIPDPMGATGSTIHTAMEIYSRHGVARKYIAMHLIVTPEYLKNVAKAFPELSIYAIRLDRGLSPASVLTQVPGTDWEKERGLNPKQYIVPGAGGLGEVINNSFV